jgi:Flp pilus assembly secretin CpaC
MPLYRSVSNSLLISFILLFSVPALATPSKIIIAEGKNKLIEVGKNFTIETVESGDPNICKPVKRTAKKVLIQAISPGRTNIMILGVDDRQNAVSKEIAVVVKKDFTSIKIMLRDYHGITTREIDQMLYVKGKVFSESDEAEIKNLLQPMAPDVVVNVGLDDRVYERMKQEIAKELRNNGIKGINVRRTRRGILLSGGVDKETDIARAKSIALAYTPNIFIGAAKNPEKLILIEMIMNVMEIEKNALKDLGIHWNPGAGLSASGSYSGKSYEKPTATGAITGFISNLFPKMRRIQERGRGRSLVEQNVVTKEGGTAHFFAGSEHPIPIAQSSGVMSVQYKKVGVTLKFSPKFDFQKNIISDISIESSRIVGEGMNGAVVLSTSQLDTVIGVKSGQSIVLGGLVGQRELKSTSKSPPNKGYSWFQANKADRRGAESREVVIFVTPIVRKQVMNVGASQRHEVSGDFKEMEIDELREQYENLKKLGF